jgi:hypothetical protein
MVPAPISGSGIRWVISNALRRNSSTRSGTEKLALSRIRSRAYQSSVMA